MFKTKKKRFKVKPNENDLIKRNYKPHIVGIAIEKAKYMKRSDVLKKKKN